MNRGDLLTMLIGEEREFQGTNGSHDVVRYDVITWRFITDWVYTEYTADELIAQAAIWDAEPKLEPEPRIEGRGRKAFLEYKEKLAAWKSRNGI